MSVPTIAEIIGWPYSLSLLRRYVARLRAASVPPPASAVVPTPQREIQRPGYEVLCGIWKGPELSVGFGQRLTLPVLVMVFPFSGAVQAVMVPSHDFAHLWLGQWTLLSELGRMPRIFVWERNALTVSNWGALESYASRLQLRGQSFMSEPRLSALQAARRDLGAEFLAGRAFESPDDFNSQLSAWVSSGERAEVRPMLDTELQGMLGPDEFLRGLTRKLLSGERVASLLDRPTVAAVRTVPSPEGIVSCGGNGYLVGSWGHGRRVKVETTLDRIVISSGGYQREGFHQVEYQRVWARDVTAEKPVRHVRIVGHRHEELEGP